MEDSKKKITHPALYILMVLVILGSIGSYLYQVTGGFSSLRGGGRQAANSEAVTPELQTMGRITLSPKELARRESIMNLPDDTRRLTLSKEELKRRAELLK